MQEAQELLKKALALPEKERADLASTLIESLDDTVDENAEAAWQEEILRRLEEVRSGKAKTTPWNDVRQKGRALLKWQVSRLNFIWKRNRRFVSFGLVLGTSPTAAINFENAFERAIRTIIEAPHR
jgi:putative addiction module component (TIGR02574 family)